MAGNTQPWAQEYQQFLDNPPKEGAILRCYGNADARLDLEMVEGKPPFLYGRAYVPCVVGMPLGWFLQPFDSDAAYGWKCILLPKSREECLRRLGATKDRLSVKALKVIRFSRTGKALLCEVTEYCPEPTQEPDAVHSPEPATEV